MIYKKNYTGYLFFGICCCVLFLFIGMVQVLNAADEETPYQPPQPGRPVIVEPGKPGTSAPVKPKDADDSKPKIPAPVNVPKPTPPAVVVPPPPQVVTGTGRNFGNLTLRVDPLMIRAKEFETIQQNIVLDNPRGIYVDEVEVVLKYSPDYLEVVDMDPESPGINLNLLITSKKNPSLQVVMNQVDTEKGQIHLIIKSLTANAYMGGNLATIQWVAKKRTFYTPITFIFPSELKSTGTKIRRMGKDLLGWDYDPSDGVITGGIAISAGLIKDDNL